jgi:hypothetical protein
MITLHYKVLQGLEITDMRKGVLRAERHIKLLPTTVCHFKGFSVVYYQVKSALTIFASERVHLKGLCALCRLADLRRSLHQRLSFNEHSDMYKYCWVHRRT